MSDNNLNVGPTWKWVVGIALAGILSLGSYSWSVMDRRVTATEARLWAVEAQAVRLEERQAGQYQALIDRMARVEAKLDQLLNERLKLR